MVSVIIPIYNEEKTLSKNPSRFLELSRHAEVIFVDGRSSDKSMDIAGRYARVLSSNRSRSLQMNLGARAAKGDSLLFLHVDTAVSTNAISAIKNNKYIGGCLTQRIDKKGFGYRFIETFGNFRARLTRIYYGDQGIFVKKDVFKGMGGFSEVPVMEDVIFSKRLRKIGKTIVLREKILVSSRRWEKKGIIKTVLFYSFLNILFWSRIPLKAIKKLYGDLR